jgi:hypothetical protein
LIPLPDQKLCRKQDGKTVTGQSKNLDEIFSINGDNIIDKRDSGTQTNPCRRGFKRKLGKIFLNLIANSWTDDELPALFCGYIKNGS